MKNYIFFILTYFLSKINACFSYIDVSNTLRVILSYMSVNSFHNSRYFDSSIK